MGTSWDRSRKTRQLQHQRTMPIPRIAAKGDPEKFVILPVSVNSYAVLYVLMKSARSLPWLRWQSDD